MPKRITEDGEIIDEVTHEIVAMQPPFFKTAHNHNRDVESLAHSQANNEPSKTQQQFAKDADINNILAKFQQTGELNLIGTPIYRDIAEEFDLQQKMVTAAEVEHAWNALSPEVRNTLRDPKTFADYVEHCLEVGDLEPLRKLGLAKPEPPQPAIVAPPVATPPAAPPTAPVTAPTTAPQTANP